MKILNKISKSQLQEFDSALFKIGYDVSKLEVMFPMYVQPDGVEIEVYLGNDPSPEYFEVPYEVLEHYISEYFDSNEICYWLKESNDLEKQDLILLESINGAMYWYNHLSYADDRLKCSQYVVPRLFKDIDDFQTSKLNFK